VDAEKNPTQPSERIIALDALRGFAILGILVMNIQSFSMVGAAYMNPTVYGDLTGLNKWVWILSHVFADQKFMTIFSLLFGAGILLFTERIEKKGLKPLAFHYRRTFWLIVVGRLHAYLIWYGDILVTYGLCALIVVLFRKLSPRALLIFGILVIAVASILSLFFGISLSYMPSEAYDSIKLSWESTPEKIQQEIITYQSGWLEQMKHRIPAAIEFQTFLFLILFGWRAGGVMMIGMAFYKWGIVTSQRSNSFYLLMALAGIGAGYSLVSYGVIQNFANNWSFDYSMFLGVQFNYWGSLLVSLSYISIIMLLCKNSLFTWLMNMLAAVGRTALSNYIFQSLICTSIFYGHGLGLFGEVERKNQIFMVLSVWIIQLIISPMWLRYFKFGPFEWLWRSLTYMKIQTMVNTI
jgi:uncharacterized protein